MISHLENQDFVQNENDTSDHENDTSDHEEEIHKNENNTSETEVESNLELRRTTRISQPSTRLN